MHEFELIARHFRPLSEGFAGALGLIDDAARLTLPEGFELVVTADTLIAGVHFFGWEAPELIARKALRVNLSDLAAKGAAPWCYFLCLSLPREVEEAFVAAFARGLAADQAEFGLHLAGGDTTATPGPLTISITAFGLVPAGQILTRSGAQAGDLVVASGTIGDAALGLHLLRHSGEGRSLTYPLNERQDPGFRRDDVLISRYLSPQPRLLLGTALRGMATACIDISDGLVQDAGHLAAASGIGMRLNMQNIPLSKEARALVVEDTGLWETVLTGGDDYELLSTIPPISKDILMKWAHDNHIPCAVIGACIAGTGVEVLDAQGMPLQFGRTGYQHF